METLYCFKLDSDTGEVMKFEIPEYHIEKWNFGRPREEIVFKANFGTQTDYHYSLSYDKLDRYAHEKVFTYNPDYGAACKIIKSALEKDLEKSKAKYKKMESIFNRFLKRE